MIDLVQSSTEPAEAPIGHPNAETVAALQEAEAAFKSEAEGYSASLRQQAAWCRDSGLEDIDFDELVAAAEFIERQQAELARHRDCGVTDDCQRELAG